MINIFDAFERVCGMELNLTFPTENEEDVKKILNIQYGDFEDGKWEGKDYNNKTILNSPSMNAKAAKKIFEKSPSYVSIELSGLFPYNVCKDDVKNILKNPIKLR